MPSRGSETVPRSSSITAPQTLRIIGRIQASATRVVDPEKIFSIPDALDPRATLVAVVVVPSPLVPMAPMLARPPFHRDGWVYEEKYDGVKSPQARPTAGCRERCRQPVPRARTRWRAHARGPDSTRA
jgi:hypothetical protein